MLLLTVVLLTPALSVHYQEILWYILHLIALNYVMYMFCGYRPSRMNTTVKSLTVFYEYP